MFVVFPGFKSRGKQMKNLGSICYVFFDRWRGQNLELQANCIMASKFYVIRGGCTSSRLVSELSDLDHKRKVTYNAFTF